MLRNKNKRIMALILSGVLLVGSVNPVTANASEISGKTELSEEGKSDVSEENAEEGSKPETDMDMGKDSAEEHTAEESTAEERTTEESGPENTTK